MRKSFKIIDVIKSIPNYSNYTLSELAQMTGLNLTSIRSVFSVNNLKYKKESKYGDVKLDEIKIRNELKLQPLNLFELGKKTNLKRTYLSDLTAVMYDIAEDDDGKLFLVGGY